VIGSHLIHPTQASDPLILTLDIGSSSARALVFDGSARTVSGCEAHQPYRLRTTPDGGVEGDPTIILESVFRCLDAATQGLEDARQVVRAVACDTFWHSLMGVAADGTPTTPVYTWADTRSNSHVAKLREMLDPDATHARTGAVFHASYWPAKLLWLAEVSPSVMNRTDYWMSFAEFLYLRIFGERRCSISMASGTGLFDQHACVWDDPLLRVLPLRREQLSPVEEFTDAVRTLKPEYARRWAALSGVDWFLPVGDGACNNVGSGAYCDEYIAIMVGTSGAMRVLRETEHFEIRDKVWTYRLDRRRIVEGGALSEGGNTFAWLSNTLRLPAVDEIEGLLIDRPPDGHGLTVLPFLAGERSPNWNPDARAALVGMRLDTVPVDIVQATLEAIAFRFAAVYEALNRSAPVARGIIGSGEGLIHSPAWMQIMCNVLGQPIVAAAIPEATSRGVALVALEALGVIPHLGSVSAAVGARYEPQTTATVAYRAARARQSALYEVLLGSPDSSSE
jgi:gluconokinase